jgi:hypothetical protein
MSTRKLIFTDFEKLRKAKPLILLVGTIGFEPTTPCPPER